MTQKILIGVIALVLVGAAGSYFFFGDKLPFGMKAEPISTARFFCDQDKTIQATFYEEEVELVLTDNFGAPRTVTVPQIMSASGARYGNEDESFVFWNKGDTAIVQEGPQQQETFSNCQAEVPGEEVRSTYTSSTMGVSFKYPKSYTLDQQYQYLGFPSKPISGVKVIIPETVATGTNLSMQDTGVSVEQLPRAITCSGDIYVVPNVRATTITENGVTYSVATTSEAAVGNRYEEMVYAIAGSKPCTAVRYFIHYSAIENFPDGSVREFDRTALLAEFDKIRASLTLAPVSASTSVATSTDQ